MKSTSFYARLLYHPTRPLTSHVSDLPAIRLSEWVNERSTAKSGISSLNFWNIVIWDLNEREHIKIYIN